MTEYALVENLDDILVNLNYLEDIRFNPQSRNFAEYRQKIKDGICLFTFPNSNGVSFAPSRFIGYRNNNFNKHAGNEYKYGGDTNNRISKIVGHAPISDGVLQHEYNNFCNTLEIRPSINRKFWNFPVFELLKADREKVVELFGDENEMFNTISESVVNVRVGQGKFRKKLIRLWGKCCVTGCTHEKLLRASHIKPWRASNNSERLNVYNGLLLSPDIDALFDSGLISFGDDGSIMLSKMIKQKDINALGCKLDKRVKFNPKHRVFLDYHRKHVFQK